MQKGLDPKKQNKRKKKKQTKDQLYYWLWYLMTKRECLFHDYMAHKDVKTTDLWETFFVH